MSDEKDVPESSDEQKKADIEKSTDVMKVGEDKDDDDDVLDSGSDVTFPDIVDSFACDDNPDDDSSSSTDEESEASEESDDAEEEIQLWTQFLGTFSEGEKTEKPSDTVDEKNRKRRLESYVDQTTQKKKWRMNTLDEAREKWNSYKAQNQTEAEEMQAHNNSKDAYLDRVEFMVRSTEREDELESEARAEAAKKRFNKQNKD